MYKLNMLLPDFIGKDAAFITIHLKEWHFKANTKFWCSVLRKLTVCST